MMDDGRLAELRYLNERELAASRAENGVPAAWAIVARDLLDEVERLRNRGSDWPKDMADTLLAMVEEVEELRAENRQLREQS